VEVRVFNTFCPAKIVINTKSLCQNSRDIGIHLKVELCVISVTECWPFVFANLCPNFHPDIDRSFQKSGFESVWLRLYSNIYSWDYSSKLEGIQRETTCCQIATCLNENRMVNAQAYCLFGLHRKELFLEMQKMLGIVCS